MRLRLGVCKTLMPDVVVPEAHQNDHSYVRELSGPTFDSLCSSLTWWAVIYTEDLKKKNNTILTQMAPHIWYMACNAMIMQSVVSQCMYLPTMFTQLIC